jgi:cellobiose-specific phosphotransferase system component IIC
MPMILKTLIMAIVTALANKQIKESTDKASSVTTQLASLPAVAGIGVTTTTEFSNDTDAIIALVSIVATVALHFYRSRQAD